MHLCFIYILYRAMIKAAIFVVPILGLTWLFGLLAIYDHKAVFAWVFTVLNSLQVQTYVLSIVMQCIYLHFNRVSLFYVLRNDQVI